MGMSRGYMHLALRGLETELREMADRDGIVMLSNRSIASKLNIGHRQINEMITELVEEGLVHKTRGLLRMNGSVKDPNGSVKESNGSVTDARHDKTLRDSKNSKKHESPKSLNDFEFKEEYSSSSSPGAREEKPTDWMIHPDQITEKEEEKVFFRYMVHEIYLLKGDQSAENLHGAWLFWLEHFVGRKELQIELAEHIDIWQSRWSKPGQLRWKPQLVNFLKGYVEGGKWAHPPTPGD